MTDLVLSVATLAATGIAQSLGYEIAINLKLWEIALIVLLTVFGVRLFLVAPYQLYNEIKQDHDCTVISADTPIEDAILYLLNDSVWKPNLRQRGFRGNLLYDLRQAASDGHLTIWGVESWRSDGWHIRVVIPGFHFKHAEITNTGPYYLVEPEGGRLGPFAKDYPAYWEPYVNRKELERLWPRQSLWRRAWRVLRHRRLRSSNYT
jgi:hypothetical protein